MPNGERLNVYEEFDHELVQTSYHDDYYYIVFFGTVDWERNNDLRRAYTVFYQRGRAEDWTEAIRGHELVLQEPAHIMEEDLDRVIQALQNLRQRQQQRAE